MPNKIIKEKKLLKINDRDKYRDPEAMFSLRAAKASRMARKNSPAFQGVKKVSQ